MASASLDIKKKELIAPYFISTVNQATVLALASLKALVVLASDE